MGMRDADLHETEAEDGREYVLLPPRELDCPDDRHGQEEDEEVGYCLVISLTPTNQRQCGRLTHV